MDRITKISEKVLDTVIEEIKTGEILLNIEGFIAIVSLNNPKTLNALSSLLISQLAEILEKINRSKNIKVVILRSNIEKAFCAGADIKNFKDASYEKRLLFDDLQGIRDVFLGFKKIIISCVNNLALGGGFEIALLSDLIYCNKNCKFGFPEIKLGLFPSLGGTLISKSIGKYKANEMILTGKIVKAEELQQLGVVNDIFETEVLDQEVLKIAKTIAFYPLYTIIKAKSVLFFSHNESGALAIKNEADAFNSILQFQGSQEGIKAFIEKRKANFE